MKIEVQLQANNCNYWINWININCGQENNCDRVNAMEYLYVVEGQAEDGVSCLEWFKVHRLICRELISLYNNWGNIACSNKWVIYNAVKKG